MTDQVRILIVDDEPAVRTTLKLAIRRRPWEVEEVDSAEAALTRLGEREFDAALIDKNLPGMTGIELVREIRKTNRSMAVIVITGFASSESATESLHLGIDAYLEKPFDDVYKVTGKLDEILAERRSQRQSGATISIEQHFRRALELLRGNTTNEKRVPELRILVVCTVASERQWFVEQFRRSTTDIVELSSSADALRYFDADLKPDLVITDTSIREPDVVRFVQTIKIRAPQAAVIVISEKSPLHLKLLISLIGLGVRVLLERPLDKEALLKKLEYVVGKIKQAAQSAKRMGGTV